jgi:hypothetical protein
MNKILKYLNIKEKDENEKEKDINDNNSIYSNTTYNSNFNKN